MKSVEQFVSWTERRQARRNGGVSLSQSLWFSKRHKRTIKEKVPTYYKQHSDIETRQGLFPTVDDAREKRRKISPLIVILFFSYSK